LNGISVRELCEAIWWVESRFNLLEWSVDGVHPWAAARINVYYALAQSCGVFSQPHVVTSRRRMLDLAAGIVAGAIARNPSRIRRGCQELVVEHPRSVMIDGIAKDVYTEALIGGFIVDGKSFATLDLPFGGLHSKTPRNDRYYLDAMFVRSRLTMAMSRWRVPAEIDVTGAYVTHALCERFGVEMDVTRILRRAYLRFMSRAPSCLGLLEQVRPKRLHLVVAYAWPEFVWAAKKLNIHTIEIQHGTFSRYHLGYSYPGNVKDIPYFPDEFHIWSERWRDQAPLPIPRERVNVRPFAHLERLKERYKDITKIRGKVVVLSQGALGAKIARKVIDNWKWFRGRDVIIKLHPSEINSWRGIAEYRELASLDGVSIMESGDLYRLLAESETQVGVFSTAIYEGLEFGCETYLLDLPGIEYMDDLIATGIARILC